MNKRPKRTFSKEFKEKAVELVDRGDRSAAEIARSLDIGNNLLANWCKAARQEGADAFRGSGNRQALEAENFKLRKENELLKKEAEFLKKASAYFAKQNL